MRSVARVGDLHACADSGPNMGADLKIQQGSPNIRINGQPAARMGDPVNCRMMTGESPVITEGAPYVLFNGKPAARMGDKISNGGSISSGSSTFFIGDGKCLISFGDGVNVSFGDGCNVFLNCRDANGNLPRPEPLEPVPSHDKLKEELLAGGLILGGVLLDEVGIGEMMQAEGVEMLVAEEAVTDVAAETTAAEETTVAEKEAAVRQVANVKRRATCGGKEIERCSRSSPGDPKIDALLSKGKNITNKRNVRNIEIDMTREEFEEILREEGYASKGIPNNSKQIKIYTRNDVTIGVRNDAQSTGGPSADYNIGEKTIAKIRLKEN